MKIRNRAYRHDLDDAGVLVVEGVGVVVLADQLLAVLDRARAHCLEELGEARAL